jgi:hypothetical protein
MTMKKIGVCVALAMTMMAGAAMAQTQTAPAVSVAPSRCGPTAAAPTVLDGASASESDFRASLEAYEAWRLAMETHLECRRLEVEEMQAALGARVAEYNTTLGSAREAGAAFQAANEAFNARGNRRRPMR